MEKLTYLCHVGIDVSKATLDAVLLNSQGRQFYCQVKNSRAGINRLLKQLVQASGVTCEQMLFCAEHTGIYSQLLCHVLCAHQLSLWMIAGEQTKRLAGIKRGKNDAQDAAELARFARRFEAEASLYQPAPVPIQRLAALQAQRKKLVITRQSLERSVSEVSLLPDLQLGKQLRKNLQHSLKALSRDIKEIEKSKFVP